MPTNHLAEDDAQARPTDQLTTTTTTLPPLFYSSHSQQHTYPTQPFPFRSNARPIQICPTSPLLSSFFFMPIDGFFFPFLKRRLFIAFLTVHFFHSIFVRQGRNPPQFAFPICRSFNSQSLSIFCFSFSQYINKTKHFISFHFILSFYQSISSLPANNINMYLKLKV